MTFQNHASNRRHLVFGAMLALVAAPWVGAAPGAAAPVREDAKPATVERRALRTIVLDADPLHERKTDARSVEVRMADGKMNVWVDGEAIDLARVREENGHLVVLDEDGKPITTIGTGFDASGTSSMVLPGIELDTRIEAMLQGLMVPDDGTFTFEFGPVSVAPTPPAVMMGVTLAPADAATAYHLGVDAGAVTLVTSVIDDLPAARAGLHQYDLITAIDGRTPAAPADLHAILRDRAAGSTITLTVIQAGRTVQIPVVLEAFDAERLHQSTTDGLLRWSPNVSLDELRVPGKVFDSIFIPRQHDIDLVLPRPSGASPRVHVEIARPGGAPADGAKSAKDRIAALREQIARLQDAIAALEREVPAPGNDAP